MSSFVICFLFCFPNQISYCSKHKVHIYLEYLSVSPLVGIGTPPLPLSRKQVCTPPPEPKGGGANSPAVEGVGESQFGRLEKRPSTLSTLWFRVTAGFSALPFDNIWFGGNTTKHYNAYAHCYLVLILWIGLRI
jgi:hypothetical protein